MVLVVAVLAVLAVLGYWFLKNRRKKREHQPVATTSPPVVYTDDDQQLVYNSTTSKAWPLKKVLYFPALCSGARFEFRRLRCLMAQGNSPKRILRKHHPDFHAKPKSSVLWVFHLRCVNGKAVLWAFLEYFERIRAQPKEKVWVCWREWEWSLSNRICITPYLKGLLLGEFLGELRSY